MTHTHTCLKYTAAALLSCALAACYYPVYQPVATYPAPYGYAPAPAATPAPPPPGVECRDYTKAVTIDGKPQQVSGHACRQPDGSWKDVQNGAPVPESVLVVAPPPPPVAYAPAPAYVYPPPAVVYPAAPVYPPPAVVGGIGVGVRIH